MRVPTPWIDALREKRLCEKELESKGADGGAEGSATPVKLTPKRVSDSFTSVVLPLEQDRFLSDGYLNSDGNIRYVEW